MRHIIRNEYNEENDGFTGDPSSSALIVLERRGRSYFTTVIRLASPLDIYIKSTVSEFYGLRLTYLAECRSVGMLYLFAEWFPRTPIS